MMADQNKDVTSEAGYGGVRDELRPSDDVRFIRGVTITDILRTHELIRRFGWLHLLKSEGQ